MFISFLCIIFVLFLPVNCLNKQVDNVSRKSRLLLASSSSWYGGSGGDGPYTMESSDSNAYITKICLHHAQGQIIGSLQVHFSNGETSKRYGGTNVDQQCFSPPNGQCITKVYIRACLGYHIEDTNEIHSFINSLQFESSDGSKSQLWGYEGDACGALILSGYRNGCLKSISVKSGTMIDDVQFHWL